ncbi:MAG: hypothetical protein M1838_001653 [Thelocarpon superellum]|nr:MAG: hypothetical protein M1838_001653 [Thelocarpon superellum]
MTTTQEVAAATESRVYTIETLLGLEKTIGIFKCPLQAFSAEAWRAQLLKAPVGKSNGGKVWFPADYPRYTVHKRSEVPSREIPCGTPTESHRSDDDAILAGSAHAKEVSVDQASLPRRQPSSRSKGAPQKDEGFARFLREVASPTHHRVTAGGRIVPADLPPMNMNAHQYLHAAPSGVSSRALDGGPYLPYPILTTTLTSGQGQMFYYIKEGDFHWAPNGEVVLHDDPWRRTSGTPQHGVFHLPAQCLPEGFIGYPATEGQQANVPNALPYASPNWQGPGHGAPGPDAIGPRLVVPNFPTPRAVSPASTTSQSPLEQTTTAQNIRTPRVSFPIGSQFEFDQNQRALQSRLSQIAHEMATVTLMSREETERKLVEKHLIEQQLEHISQVWTLQNQMASKENTPQPQPNVQHEKARLPQGSNSPSSAAATQGTYHAPPPPPVPMHTRAKSATARNWEIGLATNGYDFVSQVPPMRNYTEHAKPGDRANAARRARSITTSSPASKFHSPSQKTINPSVLGPARSANVGPPVTHAPSPVRAPSVRPSLDHEPSASARTDHGTSGSTRTTHGPSGLARTSHGARLSIDSTGAVEQVRIAAGVPVLDPAPSHAEIKPPVFSHHGTGLTMIDQSFLHQSSPETIKAAAAAWSKSHTPNSPVRVNKPSRNGSGQRTLQIPIINPPIDFDAVMAERASAGTDKGKAKMAENIVHGSASRRQDLTAEASLRQIFQGGRATGLTTAKQNAMPVIHEAQMKNEGARSRVEKATNHMRHSKARSSQNVFVDKMLQASLKTTSPLRTEIDAGERKTKTIVPGTTNAGEPSTSLKAPLSPPVSYAAIAEVHTRRDGDFHLASSPPAASVLRNVQEKAREDAPRR